MAAARHNPATAVTSVPGTQPPSAKREQASPVQGVTFKQKEVTGGNTYQVYIAPGRSKAIDSLRATEVKRERECVIVETPEGAFGKDLIMIFDEGTSAKGVDTSRYP